MKKINLLVSLVFSLFLLTILTTSFVSGAITLVTPAGSSTVGGTSPFQVIVPSADSGGVAFNCTLYAKSTLTANNSWVYLKVVLNNTVGHGNGTSVNNTFASATLEDANNYIFNATCRNITKVIGSVTNSVILVDNIVPTAPSALTPTSDTDGTVDFSSTVVGRETTSCILYFTGSNPGLSSYAMVHTIGTNTCTYSSLSMPEQTYNWYVTASDETNTTNSATQTTNVDVYGGSAAKIPALLQEPGVQSTGGATLSVTGETITDKIKSNIGIIAVILVVIVVVVIWIKRK
jgi:cobalamin biosynthesis Mg chelatase CobN